MTDKDIRSREALWANQANTIRRIEALSADVQRLFEMLREFNLNRTRTASHQLRRQVRPGMGLDRHWSRNPQLDQKVSDSEDDTHFYRQTDFLESGEDEVDESFEHNADTHRRQRHPFPLRRRIPPPFQHPTPRTQLVNPLTEPVPPPPLQYEIYRSDTVAIGRPPLAREHNRDSTTGVKSNFTARVQTDLPQHDSASASASSRDPTHTIQIAMVRLEEEFHHILVSRAIAFETDSIVDLRSLSLPRSCSGDLASYLPKPNAAEEGLGLRRSTGSSGNLGGSSTSSYHSTSSICEIDLLPNDATQDLRSIADRMIVAGYGRECFQVYGSVRKSAVELCFRHLEIERLSFGNVQRLDWLALRNQPLQDLFFRLQISRQQVEVDASILIPGDPLKIDQSALTGESLTVTKYPGNVVYSGSTCKQGEIEAEVIATGVHTFFGKAAHLVNSTKHGATTNRMPAIEEMAGMDVLCSDKTGILTLNKPTVEKNLIEVFAEGYDKDLVVLMAARASRLENQDVIDTAIVSMLSDMKEARAGIQEVHFIPFNPTDKRTSLTYLDAAGIMHRASEGAPEQILSLSWDKSEIERKVHATIEKFADRGLYSLSVANGHETIVLFAAEKTIFFAQVLHMDRNVYYGGESTSLNLVQILETNSSKVKENSATILGILCKHNKDMVYYGIPALLWLLNLLWVFKIFDPGGLILMSTIPR